jgi:hypothetical protein
VIFWDLWERRTRSTLTGQTLSTLSPEDRALLLLVHGTKHGWRQLLWVYDLAEIYKQDIDWHVVLTRAKKYRWRHAVLYGIAVLTEFTGLSVPSAMESELKSSRLCSWGANQTVKQIRNNLGGVLTHLEPVTTAMFLNDSLSGAFAACLDEVLAPRKTDYEWISLPPRLYPLYYLVRPCHVFVNTIKRFTGQ